MQTTLIRRLALPALLFGALLALTAPARASLLTDVQTLNGQATTLKDYLTATNLATDPVCSRLVEANRQARALVNGIAAVDANLAAPLTIDSTTLDALDQLSVTTLALANESTRLSLDLGTLSTVANALTIKDGITAMLQLSDDIGAMADRIGEMSDKILTMSDDIGLMADRIIITQQLQNQNVALTTQSLLATQTNALALVSVLEDSSYNVSIANLIAAGTQLAAEMQALTLKARTLDTQMATVATDVRGFLTQVQALRTTLASDASLNTMTFTPTGLAQLTDLSAMLAGLGTAVDGYVIAIGGLQAITASPTLYDSLKSMLQLSADIGVMANRILEMGDQILVMADNIGMQADLILATQSAMNGNVAGVQTSILGAQTFAVSLIAARSL